MRAGARRNGRAIRKEFQEMGPIPFLPENRTALIATGSHMIATPPNFKSQTSGHNRITILSNPNVKIPEATLQRISRP